MPQWVMKTSPAINYVRALEAIRTKGAAPEPAQTGTRGYADGGYVSPITPPDPALAELPVLIKRLCNVLDRIDKNGVSANIGVTELEAQQKRLQKARQWAE